MALPYPEGEVYFKRSSLKYPGFAIDTDDKTFYSHALVETVWNSWFNHNDEAKNTKPHVRAKHVQGLGMWYATLFGVWSSQSALFGDSNDGTNITREVVLGKNTNFNEVRDKDQGGPYKVHLQPIPLGPERYMYLDLTVPVRAVYFPIAAKSSALNEDLCTYLMVDFRLRKGVKMRSRQSGKVYDVPYSYSKGLGWRAYESLCFDIPGIYAYLVLPHKMRSLDQGLYQTAVVGEELINLFGAENINDKAPAVANRTYVDFHREIDLAAVISDNFGVDICWTPYEYNVWVFDVLQNVVYLGLSFIPTAGPLCAVAFTIFISAVNDPEAFKAENILKLSPELLVAVVTSAAGMKKNMPKGFFKALK
ncbi:MAG: hypothetical protein Q9208_005288 [Pyrenodesmia sp. 3 TL-2023]